MGLALFVLVMLALLVLALAIPRWSLLVLPVIVVMVQWQIDTPAPDDDVARAIYSMWYFVYALPLVVGILVGKLVRIPGKAQTPRRPSD